MGRYAYFSTGFEYKFVFGVQPSTDIALYGKEFEDEEGEPCHEWTETDIPLLKVHLSSYTVDWDLYPKTAEGTDKLLWALRKENLPNDAVLGLIIYHQLLYCCPLSVEYEL